MLSKFSEVPINLLNKSRGNHMALRANKYRDSTVFVVADDGKKRLIDCFETVCLNCRERIPSS
jgi:hypothetical protein